MSSFPNTASKLSAPTKKSIFERQKEETEAKKARERAETAAVYEEFIKSFDDEAPSAPISRGRPPGGLGMGSAPGPGKRHFTSSGMKSGPGSLGPSPSAPKSGPGSLGPTFGKKRPFDDFSGRRDRDRKYGYEERQSTEERTSIGKDEPDHLDEEEKAARPTLHLSSLPPGTSPTVVKALFAHSPLVVENVRIIPGSTADRKSMSAIVTLAAETAATDIDTVVSHLQNKYLGFGFKLSLSRHLSSAALIGAGNISAPGSNLASLPFGAKPIQQQTSLSRAPPPGQGRGFAPPTSYTSSVPYGGRPQSQVLVQPPTDLKQLKLIHKTLEALLTYGPEFEALLMSRPQIQREEQWSWIWNPQSQGGVYYRWRLWQILTDTESRGSQSTFGARQNGDVLFEGQSLWVPPTEGLRFQFTTQLEEFVSDDDYNSSDEEGDEDGAGISRRHNDHNVPGMNQDTNDLNDGPGYLNPLAKAKLIHLLSRLPEVNTKLRKGDIARVTGFAIEQAGAGADEVAALITRNVVQPFSQQRKNEDKDDDDDSATPTNTEQGQKDTSAASLVGLYVISDILSSSASAGVRHAWRYRQLFEVAIAQQKVFEKLGRIDRDLNWGKLKAEKWKRSVHNLLQLWEGWCVFPQASHDEMVEHFSNPPLSREEQKKLDEEERRKGEEETQRRKSGLNKWRSVEAEDEGDAVMGDAGVDGQVMVDDEDEDEDMNVDETTLIDDAIDGIPLADSSDEEMAEDTPEVSKPSTSASPAVVTSSRRQRPKATDMFADESS
ncbi:uncharacterized protein HMPREF1541_01273 [Cyphellophora europaea CBS 101466]|uniref:CID domain-containing protein n=1 Tax=Cyphellophora europaea (strain CBS 101466) TaxID=1220924 RepID=W2SGF3_CYPE1|nr:uncharacterized protein HMPREF1541_01273 [Cyphellophora europaea CBS 101466]ETN47083.1 hypothetical protein HMPREF1541_01273 [Cyphellophora europaea CBS 101466]